MRICMPMFRPGCRLKKGGSGKPVYTVVHYSCIHKVTAQHTLMINRIAQKPIKGHKIRSFTMLMLLYTSRQPKVDFESRYPCSVVIERGLMFRNCQLILSMAAAAATDTIAKSIREPRTSHAQNYEHTEPDGKTSMSSEPQSPSTPALAVRTAGVAT